MENSRKATRSAVLVFCCSVVLVFCCSQPTNSIHSERTEANTAWLEDMIVRLVCVLSLDRFGDYLNEQVSCLSPRRRL